METVSCIQRAIDEAREQYLGNKQFRYENRIAKIIRRDLRLVDCMALPEDHLTTEQLRTSTPFHMFTLNVSWPYSALIAQDRYTGPIRKALEAAAVVAGRNPFMVAFDSGGVPLAAHNMPCYSITRRRFQFRHKYPEALFLDPLRPMLRAINWGRNTDPAQDRHLRPNRFARIPGVVVDLIDKLGKPEWRLLVTMSLRADYHTGRITIGQRKLGDEAGVCQSSVPAGLRTLLKLGLLHLEKNVKGQNKTYVLPLPVKTTPAFLNVSDWVMPISDGLGKSDWATYIATCSLASFRSGAVTATHKEIAKTARMRANHIPESMAKLSQAGLLIPERDLRSGTVTYWLPRPGE